MSNIRFPSMPFRNADDNSRFLSRGLLLAYLMHEGRGNIVRNFGSLGQIANLELSNAAWTRRESGPVAQRIGRMQVRVVRRRDPGKRIHGQPETQRRIAGNKVTAFRPQEPWAGDPSPARLPCPFPAFPSVPVRVQRQDIANHLVEPLFE